MIPIPPSDADFISGRSLILLDLHFVMRPINKVVITRNVLNCSVNGDANNGAIAEEKEEEAQTFLNGENSLKAEVVGTKNAGTGAGDWAKTISLS